MDEDEDFKNCARYKKGRRRALFKVETRRYIVWDQEKLKKIIKIVHEDLRHYSKKATTKAIKQWF
jgi:hypothetical protein